MLNMMFGGGGGGRGGVHVFEFGARPGGGGGDFFHFGPPPPMAAGPPPPLVKPIVLTLEQCYTGCTLPVEIERVVQQYPMQTSEKETLYVDIPKGIDDNEIIILREKGNILNETIKGDVKLFVKINNSTCFIRSGLDLLLQKSISLKDALCGFTFELKYVNGKMYTLNCNSGNIIYHGYKKILPNMGLTRDGHTGNLIIEFQVDFPEMMTEKQIQALKEIL
jgi:DnaJ-class molecular chaperone